MIEDSNNGLRAAKAAGMRCIVTMSSYTADEDFSLADKVVHDLDAGVDIELCRSAGWLSAFTSAVGACR